MARLISFATREEIAPAEPVTREYWCSLERLASGPKRTFWADAAWDRRRTEGWKRHIELPVAASWTPENIPVICATLARRLPDTEESHTIARHDKRWTGPALCVMHGKYRVSVDLDLAALQEAARAHVLALPQTNDSWTQEAAREEERVRDMARQLNAKLSKVRKLLVNDPSSWDTLTRSLDRLCEARRPRLEPE